MSSDAIPSAARSGRRTRRGVPRRRRRGEHPTAAEYAAATPSTPREILELFPALELIEGLKPMPDEHTGSSATRGTVANRRPAATPRGGWATTPCSARSAAAGWASSTKPSTSRSRAGWR